MEEFVITNEADGLALFVFKPKNPKFAWGTKFVDTDADEVINVRLFNACLLVLALLSWWLVVMLK